MIMLSNEGNSNLTVALGRSTIPAVHSPPSVFLVLFGQTTHDLPPSKMALHNNDEMSLVQEKKGARPESTRQRRHNTVTLGQDPSSSFSPPECGPSNPISSLISKKAFIDPKSTSSKGFPQEIMDLKAQISLAFQFALTYHANSSHAETLSSCGILLQSRSTTVIDASFIPLDAEKFGNFVNKALCESVPSESTPFLDLQRVKYSVEAMLAQRHNSPSSNPRHAFLLLPCPKSLADLHAFCKSSMTLKETDLYDEAGSVPDTIAILFSCIRRTLTGIGLGLNLDVDKSKNPDRIFWVDIAPRVTADEIFSLDPSERCPSTDPDPSIIYMFHELIKTLFNGAYLPFYDPFMSHPVLFEEWIMSWDLLSSTPNRPITNRVALISNNATLGMRIRSQCASVELLQTLNDDHPDHVLLPLHTAPEKLAVVCTVQDPHLQSISPCLLSSVHLYSCSYSYANESKSSVLALYFKLLFKGEALLVSLADRPESHSVYGMLFPSIPGTLILKLFLPPANRVIFNHIGKVGVSEETAMGAEFYAALGQACNLPRLESHDHTLVSLISALSTPISSEFLSFKPVSDDALNWPILCGKVFRRPPFSAFINVATSSDTDADQSSSPHFVSDTSVTCNALDASESTTMPALSNASVSRFGIATFDQAGFDAVYYQFVYSPDLALEQWMSGALPLLYDGLQEVNACKDPVHHAMCIFTCRISAPAALEAKYRAMLKCSPVKKPSEIISSLSSEISGIASEEESYYYKCVSSAAPKSEMQKLQLKEAQMQVILLLELLRLHKETGCDLPPLPSDLSSTHVQLLVAYINRINLWHALVSSELIQDLAEFTHDVLVDFYHESFPELVQDLLSRLDVDINRPVHRNAPKDTISSPFFKKVRLDALATRDKPPVFMSPKAVGNRNTKFLQHLAGRTVALQTKKTKKHKGVSSRGLGLNGLSSKGLAISSKEMGKAWKQDQQNTKGALANQYINHPLKSPSQSAASVIFVPESATKGAGKKSDVLHLFSPNARRASLGSFSLTPIKASPNRVNTSTYQRRPSLDSGANSLQQRLKRARDMSLSKQLRGSSSSSSLFAQSKENPFLNVNSSAPPHSIKLDCAKVVHEESGDFMRIPETPRKD